MYQNQNSLFQKNGRVLITFMLMVLFSMPVLAVEGRHGHHQTPDVDSIYETIRHASPEYEGIVEEVVTFQNEGMTLVATLVLPKKAKRPPIVITLNGFAEDRFYKVIPNTGGEHFYVRLSRLLAGQGIATLRVDYRGSGESDGDYTMTTFSTQISDALAAVEYVTSELRHVVNTRRLGMFGFSQGGLVTAVAVSKDRRIGSAVIWSGVVTPTYTYGNLLTFDGLKRGTQLIKGGSTQVPIYVGELYLGDIELGDGFFKEVFTTDPRAAMRDYDGPVMYVGGASDPIVYPQPAVGQSLLDNHDGPEKMVLLPGDHEFDSDYGPEQFDDAAYWASAWYLATLN